MYVPRFALQVRPLPPSGPTLNRRFAVQAVGVISAFSTVGFLGYRLFVSTPRYNGPELDMQNKTVIVTEPSARLSRELLQNLARRGANLILACSDPDVCTDTKEKMLRVTKTNPSRVICRRLEMNSSTSVRRFAAEVLADHPKLDRVIIQSPSCVTGVIAGKRRPTFDGIEHELGTNYFNAYLLSRLLWDRVDSSNGRLILVADTDAATTEAESAPRMPNGKQLEFPMDDLNFESDQKYEPKKAYQRSQWFLQMFADELSRRTAGKTNASIVLVNPRISHSTAPPPDANSETSSGFFERFLDYGARLLRRKAASTTFFCTVADLKPVGQQNEQQPSDSAPSNASSDRNVKRAPVYQDLRLIHCPTTTDEITESSRTAAEILWKVSDKWTRLDTHPAPLPLPPRPLRV
ncbi:unnamed protein product [Calicophoron daubneyi]|uniref:Retinol dehydrogenase 13 n=1 Tax=Calicophoron daubneyi TaxID=300641 RepID=A0AAV2T6D1_CALDB